MVPRNLFLVSFHKVNQRKPSLFHHWIINQVKNNWSAPRLSPTYRSTHWTLLKDKEGDESDDCIEKWANEGPCAAASPLSFFIILLFCKLILRQLTQESVCSMTWWKESGQNFLLATFVCSCSSLPLWTFLGNPLYPWCSNVLWSGSFLIRCDGHLQLPSRSLKPEISSRLWEVVKWHFLPLYLGSWDCFLISISFYLYLSSCLPPLTPPFNPALWDNFTTLSSKFPLIFFPPFSHIFSFQEHVCSPFCF